MKKFLFIFLILLSTSAFAEDIRDIKIDGQEFVAFDTQSAMKLLRMRMDYPKLELEIDRLKELVALKDQEISLLTDIQSNNKEQINLLIERNTDLQKQILHKDAWWKSPWLWAAVGVAAGSAICISVGYAVK